MRGGHVVTERDMQRRDHPVLARRHLLFSQQMFDSKNETGVQLLMTLTEQVFHLFLAP